MSVATYLTDPAGRRIEALRTDLLSILQALDTMGGKVDAELRRAELEQAGEPDLALRGQMVRVQQSLGGLSREVWQAFETLRLAMADHLGQVGAADAYLADRVAAQTVGTAAT